MNHSDFLTFCNNHKLVNESAGRDWYDADVRGAYRCAIVRDVEDFTVIKALLDNDDIYLVSAERTAGHSSFNYSGYGRIFADDARGIAMEIAKQFSNFLSTKNSISYYDADEIAARDKTTSENPVLENEPEGDYFNRVAEMSDSGCLVPLYVTEPGFWDSSSEELLLSDIEKAKGIWSYQYNNWEQCVIAILNEKDTDDEGE